jgi:hypothetical protein
MDETIDAEFIEIEELPNGYRTITSDPALAKEVTIYKKGITVDLIWCIPYKLSFYRYIFKVFEMGKEIYLTDSQGTVTTDEEAKHAALMKLYSLLKGENSSE